jgi:hypothetical protein
MTRQENNSALRLVTIRSTLRLPSPAVRLEASAWLLEFEGSVTRCGSTLRSRLYRRH